MTDINKIDKDKLSISEEEAEEEKFLKMTPIELNYVAHAMLSFRNRYHYYLIHRKNKLIFVKKLILSMLRDNPKLQKEFDKIDNINFLYDFHDRLQITRTLQNR